VVVSVVNGEFEGHRVLQVQRGADIRAVVTLYEIVSETIVNRSWTLS